MVFSSKLIKSSFEHLDIEPLIITEEKQKVFERGEMPKGDGLMSVIHHDSDSDAAMPPYTIEVPTLAGRYYIEMHDDKNPTIMDFPLGDNSNLYKVYIFHAPFDQYEMIDIMREEINIIKSHHPSAAEAVERSGNFEPLLNELNEAETSKLILLNTAKTWFNEGELQLYNTVFVNVVDMLANFPDTARYTYLLSHEGYLRLFDIISGIKSTEPGVPSFNPEHPVMPTSYAPYYALLLIQVKRDKEQKVSDSSDMD